MASAESVGIVQTGVANLASVQAALRRAGISSRLVQSPAEVDACGRLVLPGVGAFAAAMRRLTEVDLIEAICRRIADDRPTLAICLGLQLLAAESEESPGVGGLSILPARIERLRAYRVPQLGWNRVDAPAASRYLTSGYGYFAHSFGLKECPSDWTASWVDYDEPIVAAIERGNVLACQFHPELSGAWGEQLIRQWLSITELASPFPRGSMRTSGNE